MQIKFNKVQNKTRSIVLLEKPQRLREKTNKQSNKHNTATEDKPRQRTQCKL